MQLNVISPKNLYIFIAKKLMDRNMREMKYSCVPWYAEFVNKFYASA